MNSTISEGLACFSAENEVGARCCGKGNRSLLAGRQFTSVTMYTAGGEGR
jgi:hypothetical protein